MDNKTIRDGLMRERARARERERERERERSPDLILMYLRLSRNPEIF